jgi:ATP-dependent DNA helicase RecG
MKKHETIDELLNATEGEHYQFKEWKHNDDLREAAKICCALANCGGGKFVIGVTDKRPRRVVGTTAFPQPERTRLDLMERLRVAVDFSIYEHENGRVLVFDVASRPIGLPIQADGGAWWYQGNSLILMPEEIRRAIYAESGHDFSGDICPKATIDDLDSGAIETFRNTWVENSGNQRIANLSVEQLLRDCDAINDEGVTYAALILFGKRSALVKHLPQAEIIFEYRSKEAAGPAAQREDFLVGFFNSFDRIVELVNLRNDNQHYQNGLFVHPVPTFNERVVREALLNAVSHREYKMSGSIFVRQYQSRIEIENPGGFPWGITVDNILDRHSARNVRIANIFQLCGLVERAGQGMNLMHELAMKEAKPLPDFSGSDEWFVKLTLDGKVFDSRMLAMIKKLDNELLEAMTTDDYLLLATLYQGNVPNDTPQSRFDHLAELGIVKYTEYGVEPLNGGITLKTNGSETSPSDSQAVAKWSSSGSQSVANRSSIGRQSTANRLSIDCQSILNRLPID